LCQPRIIAAAREVPPQRLNESPPGEKGSTSQAPVSRVAAPVFVNAKLKCRIASQVEMSHGGLYRPDGTRVERFLPLQTCSMAARMSSSVNWR
jgi:hypothetical protein